MSKPLKAITLHRPWAYAVADLGKSIENRTWPCPLTPGSLIAIHAGKRWDQSGADWIESVGLGMVPPKDEHPDSVITAIARFQGNVSESASPWFVGPTGWMLSEVTPITPVACRGRQGLWNVPEDVLPVVREAYRNALGETRSLQVPSILQVGDRVRHTNPQCWLHRMVGEVVLDAAPGLLTVPGTVLVQWQGEAPELPTGSERRPKRSPSIELPERYPVALLEKIS